MPRLSRILFSCTLLSLSTSPLFAQSADGPPAWAAPDSVGCKRAATHVYCVAVEEGMDIMMANEAAKMRARSDMASFAHETVTAMVRKDCATNAPADSTTNCSSSTAVHSQTRIRGMVTQVEGRHVERNDGRVKVWSRISMTNEDFDALVKSTRESSKPR